MGFSVFGLVLILAIEYDRLDVGSGVQDDDEQSTLYVEGLCRREVLDGMVVLDGNGRRPDVVGDVSISSPRRCQDRSNHLTQGKEGVPCMNGNT